jgi:hypothetical protein
MELQGWLARGMAAFLLLLMPVGCNSGGSGKDASGPDGATPPDSLFRPQDDARSQADSILDARADFVAAISSDGPSDTIPSDDAVPEVGPRDSTPESASNDVLSEDTELDPCRPACLYHLVGGCLPGGGCTSNALGQYCYGNGVKEIPLPPGGINQQQIIKDGVLCAIQQVGGTFVDPNGSVLGQLQVNSDGTSTVTCTGEAPVIIPATCVSPAAGCVRGTCNAN